MLIALTVDIVAAHVSHNMVGARDLPRLIADVHQALKGLGVTKEQPDRLEPAVSIRASVKLDHLVCLEDGKSFKMLKRHLRTEHKMTPDEYRAKWGLTASYPMVAATYSATRQDVARRAGLGRKSRDPVGELGKDGGRKGRHTGGASG